MENKGALSERGMSPLSLSLYSVTESMRAQRDDLLLPISAKPCYGRIFPSSAYKEKEEKRE